MHASFQITIYKVSNLEDKLIYWGKRDQFETLKHCSREEGKLKYKIIFAGPILTLCTCNLSVNLEKLYYYYIYVFCYMSVFQTRSLNFLKRFTSFWVWSPPHTSKSIRFFYIHYYYLRLRICASILWNTAVACLHLCCNKSCIYLCVYMYVCSRMKFEPYHLFFRFTN